MPVTDRLIDLAANGQSGAVSARMSSSAQSGNRRERQRHTYTGWVALVLVSAAGIRSRPMLLRAKDISVGGVSVLSRHMIHPGAEGALQLMRSDGRTALVGVRACYCHYIGNSQHHTGLTFTPLTDQMTPTEFLDDKGRLLLLDPGLAENRRKPSSAPAA